MGGEKGGECTDIAGEREGGGREGEREDEESSECVELKQKYSFYAHVYYL